ncbi:DNA-protecting protein DprA [Desulfovibrio sp. UIB00]|uniref:DNA-processing protein DprA n=1 Tax=Desulfovibrio sp. UIB00 TaxID=2804314 RepID=UPI001F0CF599|nr:DNA-processing protein DprA [Desulfovibrio sp. UIB00]MCH5145026.1 DNA-protecting protein DprA [Desulfovibrio sp. UIB00]
MSQPCKTLAVMDEAARKEYWASLALRHCRGLGARSAARLARHFGSAYAAVQARELWHEAGVNKGQAAELATGSWRVTAREEWDRARDLAASIVLWTDPEYPVLLRPVIDAPLLLYCRGDLSLLQSPGFAVVGSRKATKHGRSVAEYMARCLSACGIAIISGMALGIDRVAHEAALARIGRSIGVLGTGIDMLYPIGNMTVFEEMERRGLLISEFAPGTLPHAGNFPIRNRIISGLSLGVLVVEAAQRSGSLITAQLALEQNREVYAVPGPALDAHCLGCQDLVRQGAHAVFSAEDVLRDLAEQLRPFGISEGSVPGEEEGLLEDVPAPESSKAEGALKASESSAAGRDATAGKPGRAKANGQDAPTGEHASENVSIIDDASSKAGTVQPLNAGERAAAENVAAADGNAGLLAYLRQHGPTHADVLADAAGLSAAAANAALVGLEMLGKVRRLPGARYEVTA